MWSKRRILVLVLVVLCVVIVAVSSLFFVSVGMCVRVVVSVTPHEVSINGCSLSAVPLLSFGGGVSSSYDGDRVVVVRVFSGQVELCSVEKRNVTGYIGNYDVDSPVLPSGLSVGSELRVVVQLRDAAGVFVAEDESVVVFK